MGLPNPSEIDFHPQFDYKEILSESQLLLLQNEFSRLKDSCYLDHAGATLYAKSQLDSAFKELGENVFSNPHSRNPSSSLTTDAVDHVRQRVLQHFGTSDNEYSVIFTSGATAALRIVGESFSYKSGIFAYLEECHTSVIGMREYVLNTGDDSDTEKSRNVKCISKSAMDKIMVETRMVDQDLDGLRKGSTNKNCLVAIPAQCNFSGLKYPLSWINKIQQGALSRITETDKFYIDEGDIPNNKKDKDKLQDEDEMDWFVILDAASYVASNKLDLSVYRPDFVAISFYKMFGWPTGIGALLIRKDSESVLSRKRYFGGGTVNISLPSRPFHVKRSNIYERFEDGTIPFLSILEIRHGLDTLSKLFSSMDHLRLRTFRLTQYFYHTLDSMKYQNGQNVAIIYSDTKYESELTQGPVVTFNLLRPNGNIIGYSEMEQIAYLHNVNLRYGCFCNQGACRRHLGLTEDQVLKHFEAGHVCGDMQDIIDGRPTGAIRASIGYMTTKDNLDFLLQLIFNCWIKPYNMNQLQLQPVVNGHSKSQTKTNALDLEPPTPTKLTRIFIYPIKSCAPFEVKSTWTLGSHGLLYDREWLIVNSNGVPLTAKREPRLCLIQPKIDISSRTLILSFPGWNATVSLPLEVYNHHTQASVSNATFCNSRVCGDSIVGLDCGDKVAYWLCQVLDKSDLRLIRKSPKHERKSRDSNDEISLANQSQFLLLSMGSLRQLAKELISSNLHTSLHLSINNKQRTTGNNLGIEKVAFNPSNGSIANGNYKDDEDLDLEDVVIENLMGRFRGNLVIEDIQSSKDNPYEEEGWKALRIGATVFKSGGPCIRCATICMDPLTGSKSSEPLLTLSRTRGGRPNFGVHLYTQSQSPPINNRGKGFLQTLRIGDICQVNVNLPEPKPKPAKGLGYVKSMLEVENID